MGGVRDRTVRFRPAESRPAAHVHAVPLDITDRAAIAALPDQLPDALDGVVNNAGIIVNGPVEGLHLDDLSRQFEVNVTAPDRGHPGGPAEIRAAAAGWCSCPRSAG